MDMNLSKARHRIQIGKSTNVDGPDDKKEFKIIRECWGEIQNLRGREFWEASATQNENIVKFFIRYFEGLDESMEIRCKNNPKISYEIISIDNINHLNKEYIIQAKEVRMNGRF